MLKTSFLAALAFLSSLACTARPTGQVRTARPAESAVSAAASPDSIIVLDLRHLNRLNATDADQMTMLWETMHAVAALQGIVNREMPRLYLNYVNTGACDVDAYWWDKYRQSGEWLAEKHAGETTDVLSVFDYFKPFVGGLVVWDPAVPSTSNVASTVAGVEGLIPVRWDSSEGSMYSRLLKRGYEVKTWLVHQDGTSLFDGKLAPYEWAYEKYLQTGRCSAEYAAYYIDAFWIKHASAGAINHHCLTNHDFFIARRAFFFDLSPWDDEAATDNPGGAKGEDYQLLLKILRRLYELRGKQRFCHIGGFPAWAFKYTRFGDVGGKHGEVETEWKFAEIISAFNTFKDADALNLGAMANASFWSHFPLRDEYPQQWTTLEALKAKGYVRPDGRVDTSRKYLIFYVGDFDAASWLYQQTPTLWDNAGRGRVPLMWSVSPILAVRAPMAMHYLRTTASPMDYFAAADNGAGYLNPSMLQGRNRPISHLPSGVKAWAAHCKRYYKQWGLSVTGFIIDGNAAPMSRQCLEAYSQFSPGGIVPQKATGLATEVKGMPILRSGPDINDAASADAANALAGYLQSEHPDFPFYWARAILKSPEWYLDVRDRIQSAVPSAEWVDAPTFFALLKLYLEE